MTIGDYRLSIYNRNSKMKDVDFAKIQMLALDVDGVLTNGALIINTDGSECKFFNSLDGHGIRMWQRMGLKVALISGRASVPTERRAEQLQIEYVFQDCHDKLPMVEQLVDKLVLEAPGQIVLLPPGARCTFISWMARHSLKKGMALV